MSGQVLCIIAGPTKVLKEQREPERWCFHCRKRHGDCRLFPGWTWADPS